MPLTIRAFSLGGRHAGCPSRLGTEARAGREGFGDCNLSDLFGDLRLLSIPASASRLGGLGLTLSGDHRSERETPGSWTKKLENRADHLDWSNTGRTQSSAMMARTTIHR
jgi:hypothetical protein